MRTFDNKVLKDAGIENLWVQENHSRSEQKGVIRGLHFQFPPFAETKMIRCIRGEILDVFVDIRLNSPTFGQWDSLLLTEKNYKMMYIPRGFAHGYCTLTDESEVVYKVDNYYSKDDECGLLWSDSDIDIKWPVSNPVLSEKDLKNLSLHDFITQFKGIRI